MDVEIQAFVTSTTKLEGFPGGRVKFGWVSRMDK